jgi:hypothetical protein
MAVGLAAEHNIKLYLYKADRSEFTDSSEALHIINEVIRNLVGDDINLEIEIVRVRSRSTGNIKYIKYILDFSEFRRSVDLITPLRIKDRLLDYANTRLKSTGFTLGLSPPFDGGKRRVKSKRKSQRNTKRTVNGGKRSSKRRSSNRRRF